MWALERANIRFKLASHLHLFLFSMPKDRHFDLTDFFVILFRAESRNTMLRWEPIWFSFVDYSFFLVPVNFKVVGGCNLLYSNDGTLRHACDAVFLLSRRVLESARCGLGRWYEIKHLLLIWCLIHLVVLLTHAFGVFICYSCWYTPFLLAFHSQTIEEPLDFEYFSDWTIDC